MEERIKGELTRHVASLRRYAHALTGNAQEADDLVHDCLARALTKISLLGNVKNLRAYLFRMQHNVYMDKLRAAPKANMVEISVVEHLLITQPNQEKREELRDLETAVAALPLEQREVLLMVGLEGLSYNETAEALTIPVGTVMSRLSRARETLRRNLSEEKVLEEPVKLRVVK